VVKEQTLQIVETARQLPVRLLAAIAFDYSFSARFEVVPDLPPGERTSARVHRSATYDIWLIRWGAGSGTVLHDHSGSAGALYVVAGDLVEHHPHPAGFARPLRRELRKRDHRPMPASHVHDVANESNVTAASIHVYSPPLEAMHHYELTDASELRVMRRELVELDTFATD
jgi:hypothetical protein